MKTTRASVPGRIRNRLLELHSRLFMQNPFNNPAMIAVMDAAARLFPNRSRNEAAIRRRDLEKASRGDFGTPVPRAGLAGGRLNRGKILTGTAIFDGGETIGPRDFGAIADAGFDFLIVGGGIRDMAHAECEKYGVGVISWNDSLPPLQSVLEAAGDGGAGFSGYSKAPAQVGDMGRDEPNAADFPAIAAYVRAYREALPGQFLFNNLLPDGSLRSMLGTKRYRDYIDLWARTVDDDYISIDHYPFYCSSLFNRIGFRIALNTYDCVADACRRTGRDFWIYTQTQGDWFSHMYLRVTYEQIRWQIFTVLCYGARSVIQVAYRPAWGRDAYGMTDLEGRPTEQYLYARTVNEEVQRLSPVLSRYRSLGVLFADAKKESRVFAPAVRRQNRRSAARGFAGIPEVRSIRSDSTALAGFFRDEDGGRALMLVNFRDPFDAAASQSVTVGLRDEYRVRVYRRGECVRDERCRAVTVRLDSCEGAFLTIDRTE